MLQVEKLQKLLRYHRQNVFGANGDAHHRALLRLKKTQTFKKLCAANSDASEFRKARAYERMGY